MNRRSPAPSSRAPSTVLGLLLAAALMAVSTPALAQEGQVSGRVIDASTAQPLSGVQVYAPDHDIGTLTGEDGTYRLTGVPAGDVQIRARLIGYRAATRTVSVSPGETTTLDFELPVSAVSMQEVVVTATGERTRRELGNAVSTIDAAETVENSNPSSFSDLLQRGAAGVTVRKPSGSVGTASSIKIRGNSSLGLSTTPIVYVDGARINNNNERDIGVGGQDISRLDDLNPNDIESIEVLKGPAAATLYGTEASSGVIRITTKQGTSGQPTRYTLRSEQGVTYDVTEWWSMAFNPALFFGVGKDTMYVQSLLEGTRFGDPFRTGHLQNYGATARGGVEGVSYYLSGEYQNDKGNMPANSVEGYSARANAQIDPGETTDISVSTGFNSTFRNLPENDNNLFGIVGNALGLPWWGPMTRPDPNSGGEPVPTCFLAFETARESGAPLQDVSNEMCDPTAPFFASSFEKIFDRINEEQIERFIGSGTFTWRPIDELTNRFTVGYDEAAAKFTQIVPVDEERPFDSQSDGLIFNDARIERTITLDATTQLSLSLSDDLGSETSVGVQWFDEITESEQNTGRVFPPGAPSVGNSVENEGDDFFIETKTLGVFAQQEFSWKDRLYLTPGVRLDDNSAFGDELDTKAYFQANGSYVMSEEDWFPGLFDQFRVRAAWGQSGEQPGSNDALALLAVPPTTRQGQSVPGVTTDQPGNPDLKPETGEELEVGFDATLVDSRFTVEFTYYDQTTKDAIVQRPLAPSEGFPLERFVNVSEIENRGIEVGVSANAVNREDLRWDWRATFNTNDNEITDLPRQIIFGPQRHKEGFPFGSYFSQSVGLQGGEVVVSDDAEFQGHPTPEWEGALSSTLNFFDQVTLFAQADFAAGHHLENGTEGFNCNLFTCVALFSEGPEGGPSNENRIKSTATSIGSEAPFVYPADFIKLRTVSLQFDIPRSWLSFLGVNNASFRVVGENLMTWTGYRGTDPEVNVAGADQAVRSQFIGLPQARRFNTVLQITF